MTHAQDILDQLKTHLALPWPQNVSGQERVLMVVYPPSEERRIRRFVDSGEFAQEVRDEIAPHFRARAQMHTQ